MKYRRLPVAAFGVVALLVGANIVLTGKIWDLLLSQERYLVGGCVIALGLYAVILSITHKD